MAFNLKSVNGSNANLPDRRSVLVGLGLLLLIGAGAVWLVRFKNQPADLSALPFTAPEQVSGEPAAVKGVSDIPGGQVVFAERTVTEIDAAGNNRYHYRFLATDFTGLKQLVFAELDDLQYEPIAMFGPDRLVVFNDSGDSAKNRVLALSGETVEEFTPPYRPNGFLKSPDQKTLAYVADADSAETEVAAEKIMIRSMADGAERAIDSNKFNSGELKFAAYYLLAWSPDSSQLYVEGLIDPNEPIVGFELARVNLKDDSVEILYRDEGDPEQIKPRELIGIYPDLGFALFQTVDFGSIDETDSSVKTTVERFDLSAKTLADWIKQPAVAVPVSPFLDPLSPNGNYLILESQTADLQGLIVWNTQSGDLERLTDQGSFLAWSPDSRSVLFEIVNDEAPDGSYQLNSLELSSRRQYRIYSQPSISEGTGLNQVGDLFNLFIGVAS